MGNDVLVEFIFEEWRRRKLRGQEQERRLLHLPLVLPGPLSLQTLEPVNVRGDDLLGVDPHAAEEVLVDDGGLLLLGSAQREVEAVEEPGEEGPGVALLRDLELLL